MIKERKVVNLSSVVLTTSEINLLGRGLNFCPTAKHMDKDTVLKDIQSFKRNLSLKVHFDNLEGYGIRDEANTQNGVHRSTILERIVRRDNKNPFQPQVENCVETFSNAVTDEIQNSIRRNIKDNLTLRERNALNRLEHNRNIVIKKADKGGATVIMNTAWYKSEALRQLSDQNFYTKKDDDLTINNEIQIRDTLKHLAEIGEIPKKLAENLTPHNSRTAEFYLLPKVHKVGHPGRPVISSAGCHTEKISAYVDEHLKPAAQSLPSYIKDSNDFIKKILHIGKVPTESILVTLDVSSLYTNIDNIEGLKAMKEKLEERCVTNPTATTLCLLMKLILSLNNFIFNGQNYQQIKGTAMGTRAAPNYANLYMGKFEAHHIFESIWIAFILYYCRFIDDLFFIWTHSEDELKQFLEYMNSVDENIKFTHKFSKHKIDFLDVTVIKDTQGNLSTDVYQKETDTHSYLHQESAHPENCKKGIPYSQFLRLRRLCTKDNTLKRRLTEYTEYFVNAGYSRKILKQIAKEILCTTQLEALNHISSTERQPRLRLITTYNERLPPVKEIIEKYWPITQLTEKCRKAINAKPQVVYRRNKNLKDMLVRSKFRECPNGKGKDSMNEHQAKKCANTRCSWCKNMQEGNSFKSLKTGKEYQLRHTLTCTSPWVIYLASCAVHKIQYVGKSEYPLNIRNNNTRNHLRTGYTSCNLVEHFYTSTICNLEKDMRIMPIEQISIHDDPHRTAYEKKNILRKREIFWQHKLDTFKPHGMNTREG